MHSMHTSAKSQSNRSNKGSQKAQTASSAKTQDRDAAQKPDKTSRAGRGRKRKANTSCDRGEEQHAAKASNLASDNDTLQPEQKDDQPLASGTELRWNDRRTRSKRAKKATAGCQEESPAASPKRQPSTRARKPTEKAAALATWEQNCGGKAGEDWKGSRRNTAQKRKRDGEEASTAIKGASRGMVSGKDSNGLPASKRQRLLGAAEALMDLAGQNESVEAPVTATATAAESSEAATPPSTEPPSDAELAAVSALEGLKTPAQSAQGKYRKPRQKRNRSSRRKPQPKVKRGGCKKKKAKTPAKSKKATEAADDTWRVQWAEESLLRMDAIAAKDEAAEQKEEKLFTQACEKALGLYQARKEGLLFPRSNPSCSEETAPKPEPYSPVVSLETETSTPSDSDGPPQISRESADSITGTDLSQCLLGPQLAEASNLLRMMVASIPLTS